MRMFLQYEGSPSSGSASLARAVKSPGLSVVLIRLIRSCILRRRRRRRRRRHHDNDSISACGTHIEEVQCILSVRVAHTSRKLGEEGDGEGDET